jgi:two-component sensor histidine kinase
MAFHELATNAGKYGSLSSEAGTVKIEWDIDRMRRPSIFRMQWIEAGGPAVKKPVHEGFGTLLIGSMTSKSLTGRVRLDYPATGLVWELEAPEDRILAN